MWLSACGNTAPALYATLTFKSDGSHFSGIVVRRETKSITITGASGDTHTFLYSELLDIKDGAPDSGVSPAAQGPTSSPSPSSDSSAPASSAAATGTRVVIPTGTEIPVRTRGFLDSCCGPLGSLSLGTVDSDVKVGGNVVLPAGASVTMERVDRKQGESQISLTFELRSADFQNRHYVFESAESGQVPAGMLVTFLGAKNGSPEAKARGINVHLESQSFMGFKATIPVTFKVSQ
jgi:hypothetical protein